MGSQGTINLNVTKVSDETITALEDVVAVEAPLQISLIIAYESETYTENNVSITMRTPGQDKELALGFLYTEGILPGLDVVAQVLASENKVAIQLRVGTELDLEKLKRNFYTSSSCGVCGKVSLSAIRTVRPVLSGDSDFTVSPDLLKGLPGKLKDAQQLFDLTGAIHAAALFGANGDLIQVREDVGRHNALDKLIGWALEADQIPLSTSVLLLSGRASFELLQKAAMAYIPVVVAVGAPSSLAVSVAKEFDITLVGFLNKNRFNIYHGTKRLVLEPTIKNVDEN